MVRSWSWVRLTPAKTSANHSAELVRAPRTRPAIATSITAATFEVSVMDFSFHVAFAYPPSFLQPSTPGEARSRPGRSGLLPGCRQATWRCIVRGSPWKPHSDRRGLMAEVDG